MKIFTRILLAFGMMLFLMRAEAQITIGTGTSTQNDPFNYYFGYGRDATIYTAVEMNTTVTGSTVTSISWFSNLTSGWVTGPTIIYLKEVGSTTAVPSDTWANTISGATSVYTGTPTWANGWNSIDITDFPITAGQNLMVLVECNFTGTGTGGTGGNSYRYTSSGSNTHGYWQQDNTPPTGNPTRDALRPNVILGGLTPPVPPANDNCAGASSISVSPVGACSYTGISTVYATQTATPVPSCTSTGNDDDVWYSFTSTTAGIYTFRYNSLTALTGTASTVGMDVYTGTCAALSAVSGACSSGFGSSGSGTRTLTLAASTTYYLRLWVGNAPNSGTFNLCVEAPAAPPANNECAGATSLSVSPTLTCATLLTGQTTAGATQSQAGCSGTADEDVWYSFVATSSTHVVTLSTVSGSVTMVTQVFSGTCAGLTSVVCGTTYTTTATGLTIGNTYYVRTHTSASGTNATFDICVTTPPPPPANDNCSGALSVPVNPDLTCTSFTSGNTASATQSQAGCTGTADDDVWFSFVATATSHPIEILNVSGSTDIVHQIFSGTCGSLVSIACTDSPNSTTVTGLTIGNTYYIRVYSWSNATAATTFDVCVKTPPPPPANDNPCGAIALAVGSNGSCSFTQYTTSNATSTTGPPAPGCASFLGSDVWFSFVVPASGSIVVNTNVGVILDSGMALYSSSDNTCTGTFTLIECDDDDSNNGAMSLISRAGLTPGATIFVRLWEYGNDNNGTFDICATEPFSNDNCAGATPVSVSVDLTCATLLSGQNTLYATQSQVSCSGTADDDVWYSFVAGSVSQIITLSNVSGSVTMVTQVFSGTCGALVSVVCGTGYVTNVGGLTIGNTYYVRVHTSGVSGTYATFDMCITTPPAPPANDNCAGAVSLSVSPDLTCVTGLAAQSTQYATQSQVGCSGTADDDVWYSFVATGASHIVTLSNVSGSVTMVTQVFSGTCASLTSVICGTTYTTTATGLTIGNTYYVRVHTSASGTNATFDICVVSPSPPPANDACANATVIADGSTINQDVTSATSDAAPTCNLVSLSTQGVWFKYTAAANTSGTVTIAGCNSTYDMRIRVYTGTCAALVCLSGAAGGDDNDDCAGPGSTLAETHTFPVSAPALHGGGGGAEAPVDYFVLITGAGGTLDFSVSALLPLELKSFTGKTMPKTNMLSWETAQERDVNTHIVERSADGTTWTELGRKAGQVSSNVATKYELEDRAPLAKAYYRLRSVDFDGKESVSAAIVLTRKSELFAITNVFPNPTDARVTVQFASKNEAPVTIRIVDLTGRLVLEQQTEAAAGINEIPVNLQSLATGVYNVTITNGAETAGPVRVIKGE